MLSELLSLPPAEQARRLATIAVVARQRKTAAAATKTAAPEWLQAIPQQAQKAWDAVKPALSAYSGDLKNLNIANPAVAATLGAGVLGGGSAISEAMRPANRRRWSNVALNAALGGALGGAGPLAVAGLRDYVAPSAPAPETYVQSGHKAIKDVAQTMIGALTELEQQFPATGQNNAVPRAAISAAKGGLGFVRDNPLTAVGASTAAPLHRLQNAAHAEATMRTGLNAMRQPGEVTQTTLTRALNPNDIIGAPAPARDPARVTAAVHAWENRGLAQRLAAGLRHGGSPAIPGVPSDVAREMYSRGGGRGGFGRALGRAGVSVTPALLGAGADYLVRQQQAQP